MKHLLIIFSLLLTSVSWSEEISWEEMMEGKSGTITDYHENGKIYIIQTYKKNSVPHGEWLNYFESGRLYFKETYKDGKKHGEFLEYYEDTEKYYLLTRENYEDDKLEGNSYHYNEDGKVDIKFTFKGGIENGERLAYDGNNGKLLYRYNYKNGKLHGQSFEYDSVGKIKKTMFYEKGKLKKYRNH